MRARVVLVGLLAASGCLAPEPPRDPAAQEELAPGWPAIEAATVRPGVKLYPPLENAAEDGYSACTANFVFSSPDNRTLYVGTASHCVSLLALGDRVPLALGKASGILVYCSYGTLAGSAVCPDEGHDGAGPNDFALIAVDEADRAKVHPAMLGFGGPTGLAQSAEVGDVVLTYGNTDARDVRQDAFPDPLDARRGRVQKVAEWELHATFDTSALPGDSGSPVLLGDGRAVGVVQTLTNSRCAAGRPDANGVVVLGRALQYALEETGLEVVLKTWELTPPSATVPDANGCAVPRPPSLPPAGFSV